MKRAYKTVEEDGGLWSVYAGGDQGAAGYVFDDGSKVAGERAMKYIALKYWHNAEPLVAEQVISTHKSFMSAVSAVLRAHRLYKAEIRATPFNAQATYHLGYIHHDISETPVGVNAFGLVQEDGNYDLTPAKANRWFAEIRKAMFNGVTHGISTVTGKAWHYVGKPSRPVRGCAVLRLLLLNPMKTPKLKIGNRVALITPSPKSAMWPRTHGIIVRRHGEHDSKNPRVRWADGWGTNVEAKLLRLLTTEEMNAEPTPKTYDGDSLT